MPSSIVRRRFVSLSVLAVLKATTLGCGTVLHPERRGQAAGQLDWGIVALDTVGLLFFFVPGVIAFAVDFNNGTIYLPSDHSAALADAASDAGEETFLSVAVPQKRLTPQSIEQTVAQQTGCRVRLVPGAFRTQKLGKLDEFWATRKQFEIS